ncbi:hypothetical protein AAMO2058_000194400 [Amorphochlora amoebiformis]|mmetsp:Transcript_16453/g.26061  ORF Transcript_16453/g.26061 Transcript_16453/m.26061 type:complete len:273 (-) Transcript_16453:110-928(-)
MPSIKLEVASIFAAGVASGVAISALLFKFSAQGLFTGFGKHSTDSKWIKRALDSDPPAENDFWVEVYKEPRHFPEMDNKYCRVIRFRFPPGDKTLYHRHRVDSFFVFFSSTKCRNEILGKPATSLEVTKGSAAGACYCMKPIIHKISNIGSGWMHGLDIEIKQTDTEEYTNPPLPESKNLKVIYDSKTAGGKRIRVYKLTVGAGESVECDFMFPRLVMCNKGSTVVVQVAGQDPATLTRYEGTYWWKAKGFKGIITNTAEHGDYEVMIAEWH